MATTGHKFLMATTGHAFLSDPWLRNVCAREAISATEYVYEYTGAMVSQDEAERRGLIYDTRDTSYLFDLNEDASTGRASLRQQEQVHQSRR
ncbi:hypothetical protein Pcac1_g17441 [Phytophthora cactorum]|nr:hypothetical protein Pcac1_g17441 [Phytophthora cactorum]